MTGLSPNLGFGGLLLLLFFFCEVHPFEETEQRKSLAFQKWQCLSPRPWIESSLLIWCYCGVKRCLAWRGDTPCFNNILHRGGPPLPQYFETTRNWFLEHSTSVCEEAAFKRIMIFLIWHLITPLNVVWNVALTGDTSCFDDRVGPPFSPTLFWDHPQMISWAFCFLLQSVKRHLLKGLCGPTSVISALSDF